MACRGRRVDDVTAKGSKLLYVEDGTEWDKRTRAATFGTVGRRQGGRGLTPRR